MLPIPRSGSNSEGSGLFCGISSSFLRTARLFGEFVRREGLLNPEFDLAGDGWEERWRACSSAILESMAPLRR